LKVTKTEIPGLLVIQPDIFSDSRGFFFESFSKKRYEDLGIQGEFVQDNISCSKKNTIRGLHYQVGEMSQGKLCQVIEGEVLDVAVDIRFNSLTYGKHFSLILNSETKLQLWIPVGFAHGFSVLSDEAIFSYKCTNYYSKEHERAIVFNDPDLNINWQIGEPVVSEKDLKAPKFKEIEKNFIYKPE
jgi:dTDP-4-dehydrorhamnose 3,5-epimerase